MDMPKIDKKKKGLSARTAQADLNRHLLQMHCLTVFTDYRTSIYQYINTRIYKIIRMNSCKT